MEELLYYIWQYKLFMPSSMETTNHFSVEVIDTGIRNRNAGPDFFNAKVRIGDTLWVGNVEMHDKASDWMKHKHNKDRSYDSVILHVVNEADLEVFRTTGEPIPQLILPYNHKLNARYKELRHSFIRPRCFDVMDRVDRLTIHSWFSALQVERLEVKCQRIQALFDTHNYLWNDILFITLARNLGFGLNGDNFERWAKKLPFRAIDKHRDSLFQVEAIFFGTAGLLCGDGQDSYLHKLQEEFAFLKTKFTLTDGDYPWKLAKIRPGSFPHIRLAQLAWLYHATDSLCLQLIQSENKEQINKCLETKTSTYWESHFIFDRQSKTSEKKMGKNAHDLLLINTVVPFLYSYAKHKGDDRLMEKALELLTEVKAENNYITRMWSFAHIPIEHAGDSQALIQLQKEYCDRQKCLYCRFGYFYLTK